MVTPKIGMVAKCRRGMTGLITSVAPVIYTGPGTPKYACRGVCIDPNRTGQPWQSIRAEIIYESLDNWVKARYTELGRDHMNRVRELGDKFDP